MKHSTTTLSRFGHPEFEVDSGDLDSVFVQPLLSYIEEGVAGGIRINAGQNIQFGSAILRVEALPDGRLTLLEPDFNVDPVSWCPSIEASIRSTVQQNYIGESVGLIDELDFPHPQALGFICSNISVDKELALVREPKMEHDEGWSVVCLDPLHDHDKPGNMSLEPLHSMARRVPIFWPFAALPVGCMVLIGPDEIRVLREGELVPYADDSFLAALVDDRGLV